MSRLFLNIISLLLIPVLLFSCRAWDASMILPENDPISPRLLTLERRFEDHSNLTVLNVNILSQDDEMRLFTKEAETNLMDPYGDKYGYISFNRSILDFRMGTGLSLLSSFLLTLPNLFGVPILILRYKVEVEVRILDRGNKLLARYTAIGDSRVMVSLYYGYSTRNAYRKAYPDALNDALGKIRPQIQADAFQLNERLQAAGRIYD